MSAVKEEGEGHLDLLEGGVSPQPKERNSSEAVAPSGCQDEGGAELGGSLGEFPIYKVPEEVWEQILTQVKADKDKVMCSRASPFLDGILAKSKPIWEFKKVILLLSDYITEERDLLNCRLVCKEWKAGITDLFRHLLYDPDEDCKNTFTTIADINRCLQKFEGHPGGNPFIDPTVHFDFPTTGDRERGFIPKMFELLEKFGKHIFNLRIRNMFAHPQLFYGALQRILTSTPNLSQLNIDGNVLDMSWMEGDDAEDPLSVGAYIRRSFNDMIQNSPLPYLPNLQTLWFRPFAVECPANLHDAILLPYTSRDEPQLKSLSILMNSWKDEYAQGLGNLEKVVLPSVTSNDQLSKLLRINNAPINSMRASIVPPAKINYSTLIKVFSKFPLDELRLIIYEGVEFVEDDGEAAALITKLSCETLRSIHFSHEAKFSYNFLKIFPSLESLKVGLYKPLAVYLDGGTESGEDLQFYKMMDVAQMYKSNIWSLLPQLEEVVIYHHNQNPETVQQYRFQGNREFYETFQKIQMTMTMKRTI